MAARSSEAHDADALALAIDRLLLDAAADAAAWRLGSMELFDLAAYALGQLVWRVTGESRVSGRARTVLAALQGWIDRTAGRRLVVEISPPGLDRTRVLFVVGNYRREQLVGETLLMPVDALRLALEGHGIRTRSLLYAGQAPAESVLPHAPLGIGRRFGSRRGHTPDALSAWPGFEQVLSRCAALAGLPQAIVRHWLMRLFELTSDIEESCAAHFASERPPAVVVCGGIDPFTAGVVLAARRAAIPTYEWQHGHLRLFDARLTGRREGRAALADTFLAWSTATPISPASPSLVVGSPSRLLAAAQTGSELGETQKAALSRHIEEAARLLNALLRPRVLVTAQPGYDGGPALEAALDQCDARAVLVRAHPRSGTGVQVARAVVNVTRFPLLALIPHLEGHVTHSSATALELFDAGVPSIVVSEYGRHLMSAAHVTNAQAPADFKGATPGLLGLVAALSRKVPRAP